MGINETIIYRTFGQLIVREVKLWWWLVSNQIPLLVETLSTTGHYTTQTPADSPVGIHRIELFQIKKLKSEPLPIIK